MPKQTSHFWAGKFDSKYLFDDFFKETFSENDEVPISKFAQSQNETWIDHDFLEIGFENKDVSLKEKCANYSYANLWFNEFELKIKEGGLLEINTIIICNLDGNYSQIAFPKPFAGPGFKVKYLGMIEFDYKHPD